MIRISEMPDRPYANMIPVHEEVHSTVAVAPVTTVFPELVQEMERIDREEGLNIDPAEIVSAGIASVIGFGLNVGIMKVARTLDIGSLNMISENVDYQVSGIIHGSLLAVRGSIGVASKFADRSQRRYERRHQLFSRRSGQA